MSSAAFVNGRTSAGVLACAFLSGVACLVLELVWSRYLHLLFGISVHAVATVLACFMVGLALGSWHLGRIADRVASPARLVAVIQVGIGLYALISPALYGASTGLNVSGAGGRVAISMLLLIVPTYLMGGILPLLVRIGSGTDDGVGRCAGLIYALNTLGAAVGAFVSGFILIPSMGLRGSLAVAAGCSVIAALCALPARSPSNPLADPLPEYWERERGKRVALVVFWVSGLTSLAYEVYWTRALSYFIRDTTYDLTIVLATFLCGLVMGSLAMGWLIKRIRNLFAAFGLVQLLIGVFALGGVVLIGWFPYWMNDLQTNIAMVERFGDRYWAAGIAIRFGCAMGLMLVPTVLFGATLPLLGQIYAADSQTRGRRIGAAIAFNTIGSAAGPILAGFVLIPLLGLQRSMMLNVMLNLLAAAAMIRGWATRGATVLAGLILITLVPPWDALRMSAGQFEPNQPLEQLVKLEFHREDAYGITSVVGFTDDPHRMLITNRIYSQNTSDMMGLKDHRRLGMIPMLLHPRPRSALALGLGAGITLRGINDLNPDRIDCVEIAPAVIDAARLFATENDHINDNPRVHFVVDDARHFVRSSPSRYDVIVLDILHPMSGGSSGVFTREYFQLCRGRVASGGLLCQWIPVHQLSIQQVKTIVATFQSVFPHTSLWLGLIGDSPAVIGCIGSEQELKLDAEILTREFDDSRLRAELYEVNLHTPGLLLSHFIMADRQVSAFCANLPIDTDNRPIIEFAAPRVAVQSSTLGAANLGELGRMMGDVRSCIDRVPQDLDRYVAGKRVILEGLGAASTGNRGALLQNCQAALSRDPGNEDLFRVVRELTEDQ